MTSDSKEWIGSIPETNDYAKGWNECRQAMFPFKERLRLRLARMESGLKKIANWEFNIMGDCVADAKKVATKALEEDSHEEGK